MKKKACSNAVSILATVVCVGSFVACSGASTDASDDDNQSNEAVSDTKLDLPASYQSQTAKAKQDLIWSRITQTDYSLKGSRATWPGNIVGSAIANAFAADSPSKAQDEITGLGAPFLQQSFDVASDEQPFVSNNVRRRKIVHNLGSAVKVELVPEAGSPYTGLFQGGIGVARMSLAAKPFREPLFGTQISKLTPGFAMKLFVDGQPSVNLHAMPGVDGIEGFDFFARPFSNAIGDPQGVATKLLGDIFAHAIEPSPGNHLAISGFAAVDQHGKRPETVKAPAQIFLVATGAAKSLEGQAEDVDFRESLETLEPGPIFDVYALDSGDVITDFDAQDAALADGTAKKIATIKTTSKVISSSYEDERLLFQHQKFVP